MKKFLFTSVAFLSLTFAAMASDKGPYPWPDKGKVNGNAQIYVTGDASKLIFKNEGKEYIFDLNHLRGKDGKDGINGTNGKDGIDGLHGLDGQSAYELAVGQGFEGDLDSWLSSLKGVDGINGTNGADGANGKSAYEIAQDGGFTGSQEEFLASLKGDKGDTGETGAAGSQGEKGDKGEQGVAGKDGRDGVDGKDGKDGKDGRDGRDATFDRRAYNADMATTAALGGLHLRTASQGVTTWSVGVGAAKSALGGTGTAIAVGLHHGISDNMGIYAKISHSLNGKSTAAFVGFEGQF